MAANSNSANAASIITSVGMQVATSGGFNAVSELTPEVPLVMVNKYAYHAKQAKKRLFLKVAPIASLGLSLHQALLPK